MNGAAIYRNSALSVSRLKLYEQCPRAFWFRYVRPKEDGTRGQSVTGDGAEIGTVLHAALETAYDWIVANEHEGEFPVPVLIDAFRTHFGESGIASLAVFEEGIEILRAYARRAGHVAHWDVLAVEQEFRIAVGDFEVLGYIDRVDVRGPGWIEVVDYKSNRKLYTRDELTHDLQLSVYAIAARALWPWATRVTLAFDMLRWDMRQEVERDAEALARAADYVQTIARRTEVAVDRENYPPRLNENCGYCDERQNCELYRRVILGEGSGDALARALTRVGNVDDLDQVAEAREMASRIAKAAYARSKELEDVIRARVERDGEQEAGGVHYRLIPQWDAEYTPAAVRRALARSGLPEDDVGEMLVVDKKAVAAYVKKIEAKKGRGVAEILRARIEAVAEKTPKTPRFDGRKIR